MNEFNKEINDKYIKNDIILSEDEIRYIQNNIDLNILKNMWPNETKIININKQ